MAHRAPAAEMTREAAATNQEFEQLRSMLLGNSAERLDQLARKVDGIENYVGHSQLLELATADIIAKALRRAEILRHKELANAIAPLVVSAIQSEIKNSKDMMVEALYPITGRLVAAAVAAAFRDLNARIEKLTSLEGFKLRARGLFTGKAAQDLALAQNLPARITRILFLERGSGVLIANWQLDGNAPDQAELVSGLIAAITEFSASALGEHGGELRTLDFGQTHVILRTSSRMIIAADCEGELRPAQETALNTAFLKLLEEHDRGNTEHDRLLAEVAAAVLPQEDAKEKKSSGKAMWILAALLLGGLIWWGLSHYLNVRYESHLRQTFAMALAADSQLAAWPLNLVIEQDQKTITIRGLVPDLARVDTVVDALRSAAFPRAIVLAVAEVAPLAGLLAQDGKALALDRQVKRNSDVVAALQIQNRDAVVALRMELGIIRTQSDRTVADLQQKLALTDSAVAGTNDSLARQHVGMTRELARLQEAAATENVAIRARLADRITVEGQFSRDLAQLSATTSRLRLELEGVGSKVMDVHASVTQTGEDLSGQLKLSNAERDQRSFGLQEQVAGMQRAADGMRSLLADLAITTTRLRAEIEGETPGTSLPASDIPAPPTSADVSLLRRMNDLHSAADQLRNQLNGVASTIPQVEARTAAETDARLAAERRRLEAVGQSMDAGQTRLDGLMGNLAGQARKLGSVEAMLIAQAAQAKDLALRLDEMEKSFALLQERLETPRMRLAALLERTTVLFLHDDVLENELRTLENIGQIALLVKETNAHIRVLGHTDQAGSATANARIAERRTAVVAQMLIGKGVDPALIATVARGGAEPISAASRESRILNRRVTFEIADDGVSRQVN